MFESCGAFVCGEEILVGYLVYLAMRIIGQREKVRVW